MTIRNPKKVQLYRAGNLGKIHTALNFEVTHKPAQRPVALVVSEYAQEPSKPLTSRLCVRGGCTVFQAWKGVQAIV